MAEISIPGLWDWDWARICFSGWWFGTCVIFPFSWECHHPSWRTHIFQRDGSTTNQFWYIYIYTHHYQPSLTIINHRLTSQFWYEFTWSTAKLPFQRMVKAPEVWVVTARALNISWRPRPRFNLQGGLSASLTLAIVLHMYVYIYIIYI